MKYSVGTKFHCFEYNGGGELMTHRPMYGVITDIVNDMYILSWQYSNEHHTTTIEYSEIKLGVVLMNMRERQPVDVESPMVQHKLPEELFTL